METKDTLSLCSDLEEQEMQQMQKQAKSTKQSSMNNFNALKSTYQYTLFHNMENLDKQLNKEVLYEKDSMHALSVIRVQFHKFLKSEVLNVTPCQGGITRRDR
ncbi:hypothetical protein Tco_1194972 [Tanacetum coccineum]